jgi:NADH:ubiquinone oxidoreductase subunit 5 (subunit L)/multisubunit Na+/H+ antiporter MnhA subunit
MELIVIAADLLTLLIGWELVGALSWKLIGHDRSRTGNAQRAAHAFITTRLGDVGLYAAAGTAFAATGSFAYSSLGLREAQVIAAGIVVAAAAKSAQLPFSPWLFSAMAGPTPVSALLHSSTMVAAGIYLLIRLEPDLQTVVWFGPVVTAIGLAGALGGGMVALAQRSSKQLLAASTTAQYGLMFVAVGVGSPVAAGALLVAHAVYKSLLFLGAGRAIALASRDDLTAMRVGRRAPRLAALTAVGALALAGVPPLGGAWAKEQIVAAAFGRSPWVGWFVVAASLLGAAYGVRFLLAAFGRDGPGSDARHRGLVSLALLAMASVLLGILWVPVAHDAFAAIIGGRVAPFGALELSLSLIAIAAGAGLALAADRRSHIVDLYMPAGASSLASSWLALPHAAERLVATPVLSLSGGLAAFDDRVIDAGVRASARVARAFSALLSRRWEISIDGIVHAVAGAALRGASGSRVIDESGIDRTAENLARAVGISGERSRRLQTGSSHHYYVIIAVGLMVVIVSLAGLRS